jgi:uncharacterized membrane protein YhhN
VNAAPLWPAAASITSAIVDWIGVAFRRPAIEYAAKPAAIVSLILWILLAVPSPGAWTPPGAWILAALTLSLIGDILLMLPSGRFLAGLAIFLLAHLGYILAFNWGRSTPNAGEALAAAAILAVLAMLLPPVRAGLRRSGHPGLVTPVVLYAAVLGTMLWSSFGTLLRPSWLAAGAGWIVAGGLAFFASDVSLVIDRFVRPLPGRRITTHILYHLAQVSLTTGAILSLSG